MAEPRKPAARPVSKRAVARQAGVRQYRGVGKPETPEQLKVRLQRTAGARDRAKRYPGMSSLRHTRADSTVVRMAPGGNFPVNFDRIVSVRRFEAAPGPKGPYSRWFRQFRESEPTHDELVTRIQSEWYQWAMAGERDDVKARTRHYHRLKALLIASIPPALVGDDAFWRRLFGSP